MPQVMERPVSTEVRPSERVAQPVPKVRRAPSMNWLGWLIVAVVVLGGAALIWYGITTGDEPAAVQAPVAIDPHESPEVMRIEPSQTWASPRVPGLTLVTPAVDVIDPHESPEIMRIPRVDPFANPRIP